MEYIAFRAQIWGMISFASTFMKYIAVRAQIWGMISFAATFASMYFSSS